ncbi:hypothetical protein K4A83_13860 [Spirulina subsalsa FACHB-351]|uniref:Uncharacterized protein n=1 Tax=Spirulina subsalsa FACHB-351 TaxID=234711 RepID=A0ABT3L767_9CYAN|nr:hypothetical protein [Spirulina subsalsa]MCW6037349.1 hypothetical protein [Spirulina subsalsa FACHB-351]
MSEREKQELENTGLPLNTQEEQEEDIQVSSSEFVPNSSALVNTVSQLSGIVSPYFIVLVGLYIYNSNFWIGIILVGVGIVSLFKISLSDVERWIESIKKLL